MILSSLAGYLLTERLGAGAMTEAFVAKSFGAEGFEKEVVVKRVHDRLAAIPRFTDAFIEETKRASALSHSNVVQLLDSGREEARPTSPAVYFVVTERVRGVDLSTLIECARDKDVVIPTRLVFHVVSEVAKALDYAHRRRRGALIHGGLSPANVFVSWGGEVKVDGFGLARALSAASFAPHETRSLPYRSPEELRGEDAAAKSDVFALGAIAFELGARKPLFLEETPDATRAHILAGASPKPDVTIDGAVEDLARRLTGPDAARPAPSDVHEELVAWSYDQGHVGSAADELAAFVSRVAAPRSTGGRTAVDLRDVPLVPVEPVEAGSPGLATPAQPALAQVRLVTLLTARHDEQAETSEQARAFLESCGATCVSQDAAEIRVVFGLKEPDGRDVPRALDAALEAAQRFAALGIGVDLGSAIAGRDGEVVGSAELLPCFRDAAALASSGRGQVLVTSALAKLAMSEFEIDCEPQAPQRVRRRRARTLLPGRFVGRRRELARLGELFAMARGGSSQVVRITGSAGSGKTRLVHEIERRILRASPETRTEILSVSARGDSAPILERARHVLASGTGPDVLLAIDDCEHLGEEATTELADLAASATKPDVRALLVFSGRSVKALAHATELDLGPLAAAEVAELAAATLGARVLMPELLELVTEYTQGSPMFVEHLLRDLAEAALVSVRSGVAKADVSRASVPRVPRVWLESSLARLDSAAHRLVRTMSVLGDGASLDEVAAVAGLPRAEAARIAESLVPTLASYDRTPRSQMPELTRAVREVARDGIPPEERCALHLGCARVVASNAGTTASYDALERIATHLAEGGDHAGALAKWAEASRAATNAATRARGARNVLALASAALHESKTPVDPHLFAEAIAALAAAASIGLPIHGVADLAIESLASIDGDAATKVRLFLDTVRICAAEHAAEQAHVALDRAARLAEGDTHLEALVLSEEVRVAALTGDLHRARAAAERALDRADVTDVGLLSEVAEVFAATLDPAAAKAALVRAEGLLRDDDPNGLALIETKRARIELSAGDPHMAIRTSRIAADLARAVDATALFAEAKLVLGEASLEIGGPQRAYAAFTAALEAAEAAQSKRLETMARARLAHLEAAAIDLRGIVRAAGASGLSIDGPELQLLLGEALAAEGDASGARAELASAEAVAKQRGHRVLEQRIQRAREKRGLLS